MGELGLYWDESWDDLKGLLGAERWVKRRLISVKQLCYTPRCTASSRDGRGRCGLVRARTQYPHLWVNHEPSWTEATLDKCEAGLCGSKSAREPTPSWSQRLVLTNQLKR
jgi:hypothetical protein